jgi:hypothetical protein
LVMVGVSVLMVQENGGKGLLQDGGFRDLWKDRHMERNKFF